MHELLSTTGMQVLIALLPIFVGFLTVLMWMLVRYIQSKTKNQLVKDALGRLGEVVEVAVKDVQQSFVSKLDTKDPESLKKAKDAALENIKSHYGEKGINELKKIFGWEDVNKALSSHIEAGVHNIKASGST